ncbi:MAG: arginine-tRNA-protein transferase [Pseudohongiellaceae bacterium]|jgi:arginine-tRNA-protein transferase
MIDLEQLKFFSTQEHPCSYLPGETAKTIFLDPSQAIEQVLYSSLLQLGFRRSGENIYRPHCADCQQCISVRVPAKEFKANRQQRRVIKKNQDLTVTSLNTIDTDECYRLFEKYINLRHTDGDMYPTCQQDYQSFLCTDNAVAQYYGFYLDDQLLAVAISDNLVQGLSAVYSFFDPDYDNRSLGTYMILWQISECVTLNLNALYLGYWIKKCQKMSYKSKFRPLELYINKQWLRMS